MYVISELIREDGRLKTYSEVGGYDLTFLDQAENVICGDCATDIYEGDNDWMTIDDIQAAFIHWEGESLYCDECGCGIESEYGDPYEEDEPEDIGKIQSDMARLARENIRKEAPWILGGID